MRTKHAGRVDANHGEVVAALRKAGATVLSMASLGQGVPDLLVAHQDEIWILEVKGPKGTLTPQQKDWIAAWKAPVHVVRGPDEALRLIGVMG